MPRKRNPPDFEAALGHLEQIVEQLEQGDLSLEESLTAYERGVQLGRVCQQALDAAEKRIMTLAERDGSATLEPFEGDPGDSPEVDHDDADDEA